MAYRKVPSCLFRAFLLCVLTFACLETNPSPAAAAPASNNDIEKEIANEQKKLDKMERDIKVTAQKLKEAKEKENRAMRDITRLSNQVATTEQKINVTILKINQVTNKLTETVIKMQELESRINRAKRLLKERVVAVYKYGGTAEFSLLMSANGTQEALSTSYMLTKIAEQDKALITALISDKNMLDKAKAELDKQKKSFDSRNKDLEKEKNSLKRDSAERNKLLQQARKDKATWQAEQDELMKASRELKSKVNNLLAQKRKNKSGATPQYYKGGKFAWPLRGKINSPYGTRVHPVFKTKATHTGIDIDGNRGDPVRAAADGEVLYTGWLRGYGQVVVLDHGGDLTTVYAHLSGIDTSENRKVKTGDLIGRVGATGVATGNHLHFEVRINGNTVDPMKYLQ